MNEQVEAIFELDPKAKIGILVGIVVLIVGGYWLFFRSDVSTELEEVRAEIEQLNLSIAERAGIAANLPRFREEVDRLNIELKKALHELPDKKEIYQLLARVSDKARDAGLEIRLFRPQGEQKKDFYAEVPVEVEVHGTYHQVATFFDEVGHLDRIVNLNRLTMIDPVFREDETKLRTMVVATSFRFLDESERPSPDAKKGKRRRRKKRR